MGNNTNLFLIKYTSLKCFSSAPFSLVKFLFCLLTSNIKLIFWNTREVHRRRNSNPYVITLISRRLPRSWTSFVFCSRGMFAKISQNLHTKKNKFSLVVFSLICKSLFVLLYFFFWPLCCLFFFDLQILITSLVSSTLLALLYKIYTVKPALVTTSIKQ